MMGPWPTSSSQPPSCPRPEEGPGRRRRGGERLPRLSAELVESSDGLLHAARLYRAGKAPVVLASGGAVPWTSTSRPESEAMAALLVEWGVPRTAILVDARSRTTRENAVETERILTARGARSLLLVTSALHMPRGGLVYYRLRGWTR